MNEDWRKGYRRGWLEATQPGDHEWPKDKSQEFYQGYELGIQDSLIAHYDETAESLFNCFANDLEGGQ